MSATVPSRYLLRVELHGNKVNVVPIWRKIKRVGFRCELVAGYPNLVCVVCAPRKEKP